MAFLAFLDSSVTDESFVDETRVWRKYKINPGIYDEFIVNLAMFFFTFLVVYKREVCVALKQGLINHLSLKCPISSQEYVSCFQIVRFYVCWSFCCSSMVRSVNSSYS